MPSEHLEHRAAGASSHRRRGYVVAALLVVLSLPPAVAAGWVLADLSADTLSVLLWALVMLGIATGLLSTALRIVPVLRGGRAARGAISFGVAAAVAVLSLATVDVWREDDVERASYVAANERILRELPVAPGARVTETFVQPYREDGDRIVGYRTVRRYLLPRGSSRGIAAFYRSRLVTRDWDLQHVAPPIRSRGVLVEFRRRRAQVVVVVSKRGPVLVSVDHDLYGRR